MYSEIKRKLIEDYGIPSSEIRFIQECKNERARKAVIAAMNEDRYEYCSAPHPCWVQV